MYAGELTVSLVIGLTIFFGLALSPYGLLYIGYCDQIPRIDRYFGLDTGPDAYKFCRSRLFVEPTLLAWLAGRRRYDEYGEFNVDIDHSGIWLKYMGPSPWEGHNVMFLPFENLRMDVTAAGSDTEETGGHLVAFAILANRPIRVLANEELYKEIKAGYDSYAYRVRQSE